jgi:hypothetical protein
MSIATFSLNHNSNHSVEVVMAAQLYLGLILAFFTMTLDLKAESKADYLHLADAPGAIGETGNLFLTGEGLAVRPLYNDIFGQTDKHLSGAIKAAWMFESENQSSFLVSGHWRFITPAYQEDFSSQIQDDPSGRYADWMELQLAHARAIKQSLLGLPMRYQLSLGLSHIGDKGARKVHTSIHSFVGSSIDRLYYTDQPKGFDLTHSAEIGVLSPDNLLLFMPSVLTSVGVSKNRFMTDAYLKLNYVTDINHRTKFGSEVKYARQLDSQVLDDFRKDRLEASVSVRWDWYRPSIKYVSSYLRGDSVRQLYLDPLAFYIEY